MLWDTTLNAGFTNGTPWLPLVDDSSAITVDAERNDPDSLLAFYRRLVALRRAAPALSAGSYAGLPPAGSILAFTRRLAGQPSYLVAINLTSSPATFAPDGVDLAGQIALGTVRAREADRIDGPIHLASHEGIVVRLAR
jgi:alpha-glucosidase